MCGRFSRGKKVESLQKRFPFASSGLAVLRESFNVAPSQDVPVIAAGAPPQWMEMRWGLLPSWARENPRRPIVNLRAESIVEKPGFRKLLTRQRCLVPADGFYEWPAGSKRPWHCRLKSGDGFGLAGVWETAPGEGGRTVKTFALVTTEANATLAKIHFRMPVIVPRERETDWLDLKHDKPEDCLLPYPAERMKAVPVSAFVNLVRNDSPECVAPVSPDNSLDSLF